MRNSLYDNCYMEVLNPGETALVAQHYPLSGSYIDVSKYRRFGFLVFVGALNSALTLKIHQDTSATQTGSIKDIVTSTSTTVDATDDNQTFFVECDSAAMDANNSFRYVTLDVAGAAGGDDYATIVFVGYQAREVPVSQPAAFPSGNHTLVTS